MAEHLRGVKELWHGQGRRVALWLPVGIALGILLRLGELSIVAGISASALIVCFALRTPRNIASILLVGGLASAAVGLIAMEIRLRAVAAPILPESLSGRIEGRLIALDRTRKGAARLLLDEVQIAGLDPSATPARVRVAVLTDFTLLPLGARVALDARISAPPGPAEPGGFDFSRQAYFARLGAVGYTRSPPELLAAPLMRDGWALRVDRLRYGIAEALRAGLSPEAGAVAAAITVGDRSGIDPETNAQLRDSGLAHLLAISGLHMGLLSALVYTGLRLLLSLHPVLSEAFTTRKLAAIAGVAAAAVYLVLSGAGVATQRAFVMASVAFLAILLDRPALTLRALAAAAVLILLLRPESLFSAGFQMSFGAVLALVAGYEATRRFWRGRARLRGVRAYVVTAVLATAMTSALAGFATAPFAAYHFNRLVIYGFLANLAATPLMGLWIMPCVILAAMLAPFGLEDLALGALGVGLEVVLEIARIASEPEGAVNGVPSAHPAALAGIVFGGLWLALWRGWLRALGILPLALALFFWSAAPRADVYISADAELIAGRGKDGRLWISRERRAVFSAETWLRRDGEERPDPLSAYARRDWVCEQGSCRGNVGDSTGLELLFRASAAASLSCAGTTLVVLPEKVERSLVRLDPRCIVLRLSEYRHASSIAVSIASDGTADIRAAYPWRPRVWIAQ